jgi:hypothetical protein
MVGVLNRAPAFYELNLTSHQNLSQRILMYRLRGFAILNTLVGVCKVLNISILCESPSKNSEILLKL